MSPVRMTTVLIDAWGKGSGNCQRLGPRSQGSQGIGRKRSRYQSLSNQQRQNREVVAGEGLIADDRIVCLQLDQEHIPTNEM